MTFHRVYAMFLRYLYASRHPSRFFEFFFWPTLDIGFYGFLSIWIARLSHMPNIATTFIVSLVIWQTVYRSSYETCVNVLDDLTEQNLINIVGSPLRIREWILAMMLSGAFKIIFTILYGSLISYLFFSINPLTLKWLLIPILPISLMSGWMTGFFAAGVLIRFGTKYQQLPWVVTTIGFFFSAVYYPVSSLPPWMQSISLCFPMTYIFEGIRFLETYGTFPIENLIIGLLLGLFYTSLCTQFFILMFKSSKVQGLTKLF